MVSSAESEIWPLYFIVIGIFVACPFASAAGTVEVISNTSESSTS